MAHESESGSASETESGPASQTESENAGDKPGQIPNEELKPKEKKPSVFAALGRAYRYIMAPFLPSEWKRMQTDFIEDKRTPAQKVRASLLKLSLYYVIFSPLVAMPFYNTIIFHPFMTGDYDVKEMDGIKKQDVFFYNQNKQRLHAWYFKNPKASKTVFISHGNAGNLSHRAMLVRLLLLTGASVFVYDYGGFGLSRGSAGVDSCVADSLAAYDCLNKTLQVPASSIVLYGESIGTAMTVQVASKRPCASVILQSGFQSLQQIACEKVPVFHVYPSGIFPCNKLDTLSYVKGKHPPILFIHGQLDKIIPAHNSDDLFKAASEPKFHVKLEKAGHNDIVENMSYQCLAALSKFLH